MEPELMLAIALRGGGPCSLDRIRALGYEVDSCLVDLGETAEAVLTDRLRKGSFDRVMMGAGLRAPEHLGSQGE